MKATVICITWSCGYESLAPNSITSLWLVKWQLEMVTPVELCTTSTSPSSQLDMEMWSIHTLVAPNSEMPSPSDRVRHP